jgi:hypothetical protein
MVAVKNLTFAYSVAFIGSLLTMQLTAYHSMALINWLVSSRSVFFIGCRRASYAGSNSFSYFLADCVSDCLLKIFLATIDRRRKSDGRLNEHLGPGSPIPLVCVVVSNADSPNVVGSRNWHSISGTYTYNHVHRTSVYVYWNTAQFTCTKQECFDYRPADLPNLSLVLPKPITRKYFNYEPNSCLLLLFPHNKRIVCVCVYTGWFKRNLQYFVKW